MLENGAIRGVEPTGRESISRLRIAYSVPRTNWLEMAAFIDESGSPLEVECTTLSANRCRGY